MLIFIYNNITECDNQRDVRSEVVLSENNKSREKQSREGNGRNFRCVAEVDMKMWSYRTKYRNSCV